MNTKIALVAILSIWATLMLGAASTAQEIAFTRVNSSGVPHAYILKSPGSNPTPVGPSDMETAFAAWLSPGALIIVSPDGKRWELRFCKLAQTGEACDPIAPTSTSQTYYRSSPPSGQLYFIDGNNRLVSCTWVPGQSGCGPSGPKALMPDLVDTFAIDPSGFVLAYSENMPPWGPVSCRGILTVFVQGISPTGMLDCSRAFSANCSSPTYYPFWHPKEQVTTFFQQTSTGAYEFQGKDYVDYDLGLAATDTQDPLLTRSLNVRVRQQGHGSDNPAWSPLENALYVVETPVNSDPRLIRITLTAGTTSWHEAIVKNLSPVITPVTNPTTIENPKYPNILDRYLVYVASQPGDAARRIYLQDLSQSGAAPKSIFRVNNRDELNAPQIRP